MPPSLRRPLVTLLIIAAVSPLVGLYRAAPPELVSASTFLDGLFHGTTLWLDGWEWARGAPPAVQDERGGLGYHTGYGIGMLVFADMIYEVIGAASELLLGGVADRKRRGALVMSAVYLALMLIGALGSGRPPQTPLDPSPWITLGMGSDVLVSVLIPPAILLLLLRGR